MSKVCCVVPFIAMLVSLFSCADSLRPPANLAPPPQAIDGGGGDSEAQAPAAATSSLGYPSTKVQVVREKIQGVEVADPYRWLEDGKSEEVQAWMREQDAFTRERVNKLPEREAIAARLRELYYVESVGIPRRFGKRYFFTRREATREKGTVVWKEESGAEHVLLDPNSWSTDGTVSLGAWSVSWDGSRVAYSVKANNSDEATLHVIDVATGKVSDKDVIEGAKYAHASWTPKGDGFYYVWLPPLDPATPIAERPGRAELRFHKLGDDPKKDARIYPATGDSKKFVTGFVSKDGRWLIVSIVHGWSRSDVYFQDLSKKEPRNWQTLIAGQDAMYDVEAHRGRFYVVTNEGAPKGRVFGVDPAKPERQHWSEIVPERTDATLQGLAVVGGRLSLDYLKDVASQIEVRELEGKLVRQVQLPGVGTSSNLVGDPDRDEAYYSFTSFTRPAEIFRTSVKDGKADLWYRLRVPVDPSKYEVEQRFATSKDGTRVPLFIVRPKGIAQDGKAPAVLFGYGGFQVSLSPAFSSTIFPWLERGGLYVYANLRGGSEYGEQWHRAGMKRDKQNTFDDYLAVAEYLIRERYTQADRLVLRGGSNGGLLVGAALTQRPDLFRVALCSVPLLDMVRYHLFGSGKTWVEEYGSAEDAEDFKALYAYSPYHHVNTGVKYPALLLLSADSDDRVDPMHARKFAALMQASSSGGPVLLRIEKHAGHGGADLVKAAVEKGADEYAFALSQISRQ